MTPIVNFDWLELYCIESANALSIFELESKGYEVRAREYGTPIYREVLTLLVNDSPWIEIRRNPYSVRSQGGVMEDGACHIRLCNVWCYVPNIITSLRQFLVDNYVRFVNISRVDICCDFTELTDGGSVSDFVGAYMREEYYKEYQPRVRVISDNDKATIQAWGVDLPHGRKWNSLQWGSTSSLVMTRLYNKLYEMNCVKPKNYIKSIWVQQGWNGLDDVWRCEFEIKAASNWMATEKGETYKLSLDDLNDRWRLTCWFYALAARYFRFRKVAYLKNGHRQRKDRCPLYVPLHYRNIYFPLKPLVPRLIRDEKTNEQRLLRLLRQAEVPASLCESKNLLLLWLENLVWQNPVQ